MWSPSKRRKSWPWGKTIMLALILGIAAMVVPNAYSGNQLNRLTSVGAVVLESEDAPWVDGANPSWKVNWKERVSACDNRPGLKKMYVTVLDDRGEPLRGVKVRFDTEPSEGIAYDHPSIWGYTNEKGYIEWNHLGVPTRYMMFVGEDEVPLVANLRTDLGNEYCKPPEGPSWAGNVPVNRPGIYSYRIEVQEKGKE